MLHDSVSMNCLEQANPQTECRLVLARGLGEWEWRVTANGCERVFSGGGYEMFWN